MKKILLSIAGYDPTAGAGILLDTRTFMHMGFHGMGIATALTAQNTRSVRNAFVPSSKFLEEQYQALRDDLKIAGIKVGMLGGRQNVPVITQILSENLEIPRVIDPIIRSSSGYSLLDEADLSAYTDSIGPQASLLTPNIHEAEQLSGIEITDCEGMKKAAERLFNRMMTPCLVKGGHLQDSPVDVLFDGKNHTLFVNQRVEKAVHGTGCFLSSSILGYLVLGNSLQNACKRGIQDTAQAIQKAVPIGHGQHIIQFCH